jgi:hypothetical protein
MKFLNLSVVVLFVFAASVQAGAIADKAKITKFNGDVKSSMDAMNAACGSKIKVTFDPAGMKEATWEGKSLSGYCEQAFAGVTDVCGNADYKDAVAKHIKEVKCSFGDKEGSNPAYNLKGTTMLVQFGPSNSNVNDSAKAFVTKAVDK